MTSDKPKIRIAKGARRRSPFASIEDAVEQIRAGRMVIVVDDEDRENEGDLTIAAEKITPEAINFMARYGRGLICMSMTAERLDQLEIPLMVNQNTTTVQHRVLREHRGQAARQHRHLGSRPRGDRACGDRFEDEAVRPGAARSHVSAARARRRRARARRPDGGRSRSRAHRRALSGGRHLRNHERGRHHGAGARTDEVREEARSADDHHCGPDPVPHADGTARQARRHGGPARPRHGAFRIYAYENQLDNETHIALVRGEIGDGKDVLVRVHSKCLTGDVFHSARCDCGPQLDTALARIAEEGRGVLLYLNQEGRGIGLANKIRAYELQDSGLDTVEANERLGFKADQRDYGIGAQILSDLGVKTMRLLTNNPRKFVGLQGYGLAISDAVPLEIPASDLTRRYLKAKKDKLGHLLSSV